VAAVLEWRQSVESAHTGADAGARDPLAALARAAAAGDAAAARALCEALAPALLRVIRILRGPTHPDVEDLLQDSLLGVLHALPSFRYESSVLWFARRVATQRTLEVRRRRQVLTRALDEVERLPAPEVPMPSELLDAERVRNGLRALLDELPPAQAETVALQVVLGHSIEETAALTGVPLNTVRSRLRLAKLAMQARVATHPELAELEGARR
jgi:RNA polymerase sigma factor (sigma-70 family)